MKTILWLCTIALTITLSACGSTSLQNEAEARFEDAYHALIEQHNEPVDVRRAAWICARYTGGEYGDEDMRCSFFVSYRIDSSEDTRFAVVHVVKNDTTHASSVHLRISRSVLDHEHGQRLSQIEAAVSEANAIRGVSAKVDNDTLSSDTIEAISSRLDD